MRTLVERIVTPPPLAPPAVPVSGSPKQVTISYLENEEYRQTFDYSIGGEQQPQFGGGGMHHVTVHPSRPQIAYCLADDELPVERHTIVVQNYDTRGGNVVYALSLKEIMQALDLPSVDSIKKKKKEKNAGLLLGPVQRLDFFDASTLYFSGMATTHEAKRNSSSSSMNFQALIVQFHRRIVILNLNTTRQRRPLPGMDGPSDFIMSHLCEATFGPTAAPTTSALPISSTLIFVGCLDGTLRLVDLTTCKTIKSARGPTEKKDYPVELMATNPYSGLYKKKENNLVRKLVVCSLKGVAILWEFALDDAGNNVNAIFPPVARMEGHAFDKTTTQYFSWRETTSDAVKAALSPSPTAAAAAAAAAASDKNTSVPSTPAATTEHYSFLEHTLLEYDAHRNLLYWFVPTGYNKSSRAHLLCWNLSIRVKNRTKIPQHEPLLVVALPREVSEQGRLVLVAGWLHPAFPDSSITCAIATHRGDLLVMSCPTNKNTLLKDPTFLSRTSLSVLLNEKKVYVHSMSSCRIHCSTNLLVGTNLGLVNLKMLMEHGFSSACSTLHQHVLESVCKTDTGSGSVLWVQHSSVYWAALEKTDPNPVGLVRIKNPPIVVYKTPTVPHLMEFQNRPVRLPPRFLKSPSQQFVCLFWQDEQRYEILHLQSLLQRRDSTTQQVYSPAVATGTNVLSFAWVGDKDLFALLHPGADASQQQPSGSGSIRSYETTAITTVSSTSSVSSSSTSTTANKDARRIRKSFNFNKIEKKRIQRTKSGGMTAVTTPTSLTSPMATMTPSTPRTASTPDNIMEPLNLDHTKLLSQPLVELKVLVGVTADAAEISGSIAAATATTLGEIQLRGTYVPTTLFGGPVLCVASESGNTCHFYTRKKSNNTTTEHEAPPPRASDYVSSGPVLPYPDLVEWNDDGRLCAVVVGNRVCVYLSDQPIFCLLGTALLLGGTSPMDPGVAVTCVKFVHGVLYCCTKTSVQCIFLGDLDREDGICHFDNFLLASKDVPTLPSRTFLTESNSSWSPQALPMALNHPSVLYHHRGSLLVSTVSGLHAIPLRHALIRVGSLIAAGHHERAQKWFAAFSEQDHEALAAFLDRRGVPEMAVTLPGLSIETVVDYCLRYEMTEKLEQVIETFGIESLYSIDMGRGIKQWNWGQDQGGHSLVVCIGAFLLSQGKAELVRRLATECMKINDKDAFCLSTLLLAVDQNDARRLMKRAFSNNNKATSGNEQDTTTTTTSLADWPVAALVRDQLL